MKDSFYKSEVLEKIRNSNFQEELSIAHEMAVGNKAFRN